VQVEIQETTSQVEHQVQTAVQELAVVVVQVQEQTVQTFRQALQVAQVEVG
jgi:hypothetical protein